MILFLIFSFSYHFNLNHNLYQYPEEEYPVTYLNLNFGSSRWQVSQGIFRYRDKFGVKRLTLTLDSIRMGESGIYADLLFGDIGRLRGFGFEVKDSTHGRMAEFRVGRIQDRISRVSPEFKENKFFTDLAMNLEMHDIYMVYRLDRENYLTLLRDKYTYSTGNINWLSNVQISFDGSPGFAVDENLRYLNQNFTLISFMRYYSADYRSEDNLEYFRGWLTSGLYSFYRFPYGLNLKSGLRLNRRSGDPSNYWFMGGFKYRLPLDAVIDLTNNIRWGGSLDAGYRSILNIDVPLNKVYLNLHLKSENIYSEGISGGVRARFPLFTLGRGHISIEHSSYYGWEYSLSSNVSPIRELHLNWRINNRGDNIYYSAGFSTRLWADILGSFQFSGNTDVDSRYYNFILEKRGLIDEVGFGGISGLVWHDLNADRIKQENEPAMEDIRVVLDGERYSEVDRTGKYSFSFVPEGEHTLRIEIGEVPAFMGTDKLRKTVTQNYFGSQNVNFPIFGLCAISGYIYYDKNRNFKRDPEEKGVPNVKVVVIREGFEKYTYTDVDGNYILDNLVPGLYTVKAERLPPGYHLSPRGLVLYLDLKTGERKKGVNMGSVREKKEVERKEF